MQLTRARWISLFFGLCAVLVSAAGFAVEPQEQLKDPALETRAREISAGLRCLVCQNQSIDDFRRATRPRPSAHRAPAIAERRDNEQVVDYVVARYGDFVLLNPRLKLNTLLLWFAPLLLIAGGFFLALRVMRRQRESQSLRRLLRKNSRNSKACFQPRR